MRALTQCSRATDSIADRSRASDQRPVPGDVAEGDGPDAGAADGASWALGHGRRAAHEQRYPVLGAQVRAMVRAAPSAADPTAATRLGAMNDDIERFARTLTATEQGLRWGELGASYCDGEAEDFFDPVRVEALRDAGLRFAADLGERLAAGGRSLYVGAGVAELAPILFESVVLGRAVHVHTADAREARLLGAALEAAEREVFGARDGAAPAVLPRWSTAAIDTALVGGAGCDHLWFVSVATDPDHFPAHHDQLYERGRPRGRALAAERERIDALLDLALAPVAVGALLHTTAEEVPLVAARAARLGLSLAVPEVGRTSGLVGDVVYACTVGGR